MQTKYHLTLRIAAVFMMAAFLLKNNTLRAETGGGSYYQLKIYHLTSENQVTRMDHYFENAYLPALHKLGIKHVGVFRPVKEDSSDHLLYVFIPYTSFEQIGVIAARLSTDQAYLNSGKEVINAPYNDVPYTRMETILLKAFPKMPAPAVPGLTAAKTDRVYELRSYESPTEKYNESKVDMFNIGDEVSIFRRLGFNAVFYGEVLAGSHMPNLMYLTTFNSMEDREKHWNLFNKDSKWTGLLAKPAYQHNVSKADITFLRPTAYSDF